MLSSLDRMSDSFQDKKVVPNMNFNKDKRLYNLLTLMLYLLAQQPRSFQNPICTSFCFFFAVYCHMSFPVVCMSGEILLTVT